MKLAEVVQNPSPEPSVEEAQAAIKPMTGKLSRKEALAIAHTSHGRMGGAIDDGGKPIASAQVAWRQFINKDVGKGLFWDSTRLAKKLGTPLNTFPQFEANPGIWVFDDQPTGVRFLLFSDIHRKNSYKGTSWEVVYKPGADVAGAFKRLIKYLES